MKLFKFEIFKLNFSGIMKVIAFTMLVGGILTLESGVRQSLSQNLTPTSDQNMLEEFGTVLGNDVANVDDLVEDRIDGFLLNEVDSCDNWYLPFPDYFEEIITTTDDVADIYPLDLETQSNTDIITYDQGIDICCDWISLVWCNDCTDSMREMILEYLEEHGEYDNTEQYEGVWVHFYAWYAVSYLDETGLIVDEIISKNAKPHHTVRHNPNLKEEEQNEEYPDDSDWEGPDRDEDLGEMEYDRAEVDSLKGGDYNPNKYMFLS
jgi:hypothetical protein